MKQIINTNNDNKDSFLDNSVVILRSIGCL